MVMAPTEWSAFFRTVQEAARALLERSGMGIEYMFYAMEYVNFVRNHLKRGGYFPLH